MFGCRKHQRRSGHRFGRRFFTLSMSDPLCRVPVQPDAFAVQLPICEPPTADAEHRPNVMLFQPKCLDRRRARATSVRTGLAAELNGMTDMSQT